MILRAKEDPALQKKALQELLAVYWRPLWVFVRRKGLSPEEAEDAVQQVMLQLLEREFLEKLDPQRGKLRSFLMTSAANHLANRHEAAVAAKRGGGVIPVPLDKEHAERIAATHDADPDRAFQQEWAATVLERALARMKEEFAGGTRKGPYEAVLAHFGTDAPPSYKETAAKHKMSIPQLKAFLHRARLRFRELVREELADTVADPSQVDEELAALLGGFS